MEKCNGILDNALFIFQKNHSFDNRIFLFFSNQSKQISEAEKRPGKLKEQSSPVRGQLLGMTDQSLDNSEVK